MTETNTKKVKVYFGLLPGYSLLSLAGALEALKFANEYSEAEVFDWIICTEDGQPVSDATGLSVPVDGPFANLAEGDILLVCSGENVRSVCSEKVLSWLRRSARFGARIGGLKTGSFVLAKAGVLNGIPTTIHWKNRATFSEEYPEEMLTDWVYTAVNDRFATAGGTASIALMLRLIDEICGADVAHSVSSHLNYTKIRVLQNSEKTQWTDLAGIRHPKLSVILNLMETNLEEPLRPDDLSRAVNISTRQLERLFRRYLGAPPSAYYSQMRLERAQHLLLQTEMPVSEIAIACGFSSVSHFTRRLQGKVGKTPREIRDHRKKMEEAINR